MDLDRVSTQTDLLEFMDRVANLIINGETSVSYVFRYHKITSN